MAQLGLTRGMRARRAIGIVGALAGLAAAGPGCTKEAAGHKALTVVGEGVINDPANRTLRFELLEFGLAQMCSEMTHRFAALRRQPAQPSLGRFAARGCQVLQGDPSQQAMWVSFTGEGFAWMRPPGRIGFASQATVGYSPDFRLHGDDLYVYFRTLKVDAVGFRLLMVQKSVAGAASAIAPNVAEGLGREVLSAELSRGFTVVRKANGAAAFFTGLVPLGEAPPGPFGGGDDDRKELAHGRTELAPWQQDYIGVFDVSEDGKALFLKFDVDGAPAVDVTVLPGPAARQMFGRFVSDPGLPALAARPLLSDRVPKGASWKRFLPVPKGKYAVILTRTPEQNPATPGSTAVAGAAKTDYLIELGDAPD
jgi:hypothetical protein